LYEKNIKQAWLSIEKTTLVFFLSGFLGFKRAFIGFF